jgi:hypothetical protein
MEEEEFYVGFTKALNKRRNSLVWMKAAFTSLDPPAESLDLRLKLSVRLGDRLGRQFRTIKC